MITYIIRDLDVIRKLTGKDNYRVIKLHLDEEKKEVKYESDYTLFELTEKLNYAEAIKIIKKI